MTETPTPIKPPAGPTLEERNRELENRCETFRMQIENLLVQVEALTNTSVAYKKQLQRMAANPLRGKK